MQSTFVSCGRENNVARMHQKVIWFQESTELPAASASSALAGTASRGAQACPPNVTFLFNDIFLLNLC